jgi:hypothetical protein
MNDLKPMLRLIITVQIFLLFFLIIMPAVVRSLQQPEGRIIYGFLTLLSIAQALFLRRALSHLE